MLNNTIVKPVSFYQTVTMTRSIILAAIAVLFFNGCSVVNDSMRISEKNSIWNPVETLANKKQKQSDKALPPETMAAIWSFGVYEKPGSTSVRGLGGRIYFYDAKNNAVTADGELIVYGFDEDSGSKAQPDKKFVFRASELQSHYSESSLGGSYSIWIPWDKVGGYRKTVTLLPVFKSKDGKIIRSEQSINLLAGPKKEENFNDSQRPYRVLGSSSALLDKPSSESPGLNPVVKASFNQGDGDLGADEAEHPRRIRTTAIPLTPNLRRQVEIAAKVRAGKKVFSAPPEASKTTTAPLVPAAETKTRPPTRISTIEGVFGAPGSFR